MAAKRAHDVSGGDGQVRVLHPACATCIYRRGNRMHLAPGRLEDITRANLAAGALLTCHETLPGNQWRYQPAVCACFWALHGLATAAGRMAKHLLGITRIKPPKGPG